MEICSLSVSVKRLPELDPGFIPLGRFNQAYLQGAKKPVTIGVRRPDGQLAVTDTFIHGTPDMKEADRLYIDRLLKCLLWMKGGCAVLVGGDRFSLECLRQSYAPGGAREFDRAFMSSIYERPFEVLAADGPLTERGAPVAVGRQLRGCRIGFDAGGSDRKVSAVIDGVPVYSEEVVWQPKLHADPEYHYEGILAAFRSAAAHMPRVDAIGVSSAGVFVDNRCMAASLFLKVPRDKFDAQVKDIYIRAAAEFGDVPLAVCNDGDVTALAGAMSLEENRVLGIAMGTSEAGGYVDGEGRITGWLNELAFMPVDVSPEAERDEWSGDIGCGVKYFSQDAVIKLAPRAGISLDSALSPAEKLRHVQRLMEGGDGRAAAVFRSIGVYLGHSLAFYHSLYGCESALLLGRVMSGKGGDVILSEARSVLSEEYPELNGVLRPSLPDEKARRVGQSVAAASLPEVR